MFIEVLQLTSAFVIAAGISLPLREANAPAIARGGAYRRATYAPRAAQLVLPEEQINRRGEFYAIEYAIVYTVSWITYQLSRTIGV